MLTAALSTASNDGLSSRAQVIMLLSDGVQTVGGDDSTAIAAATTAKVCRGGSNS